MTAPAAPEAVIFDCDGLTLDTEWPGYAAAAEVFDVHGESLDVAWWRTCVGTSSGLDWKGELEERLGAPIDRARADEIFENSYRSQLAVLEPLPGVRELMAEVAGAGIPIGVASSSPRSWVHGHLSRTGLLPMVNIIRGREDVAELKPAPEVYLSACAELGVAPGRSVGLEDSAPGSLAVQRAGMACVVVPNRITLGSEFGSAAVPVRSMAEVSLLRLCELLATHRPLS